MHKLKLTDKIKTINSGLFILFGILIIIRSAGLTGGIRLWFPFLIGMSFIGFGIYRIRFILKYLRGGQ